MFTRGSVRGGGDVGDSFMLQTRVDAEKRERSVCWSQQILRKICEIYNVYVNPIIYISHNSHRIEVRI